MRTYRVTGLAVLVGVLVAAAAACGSDDPILVLGVAYPSIAVEKAASSLHFWVLDDGGEPPLTCRDLKAGKRDPYDLGVNRLVDTVVFTADGGTRTIEGLPEQKVIVYAEANGFTGEVLLNGCADVSISSGRNTLTIALTVPGTFDCADPQTANGAACDDGLFCTVGETCSTGMCRGGAPRDCTHVADSCNGEACSEELGCHPNPVPNGRLCEDGMFCTVGETCQNGQCVSGRPRDCSADNGLCQVAVCNEVVDDCLPQADDTLVCVSNVECLSCSNGTCTSSRSCAVASNACNQGSCDPAGTGGCIQIPINQGLGCSSNCTTGGTCNNGVCTGGTPTNPSTTEGPSGDATCRDFIDNDCDGAQDAADPGCQ
jgi:hypothetical protein